jgi:flagellum-specific ATP synthase
MRLRAMISRFESSRDLRLMGGYQAGSDPLMDQAVGFTPKIYEAMNQSREDPPSVDAFRELANALQSDKPAG